MRCGIPNAYMLMLAMIVQIAIPVREIEDRISTLMFLVGLFL